jgi:hypothetical protein
MIFAANLVMAYGIATRRIMDAAGVLRRIVAYGLLTASAWSPLLAAYGDNPGPVIAALVGVLGGVGTGIGVRVAGNAADGGLLAGVTAGGGGRSSGGGVR